MISRVALCILSVMQARNDDAERTGDLPDARPHQNCQRLCSSYSHASTVCVASKISHTETYEDKHTAQRTSFSDITHLHNYSMHIIFWWSLFTTLQEVHANLPETLPKLSTIQRLDTLETRKYDCTRKAKNTKRRIAKHKLHNLGQQHIYHSTMTKMLKYDLQLPSQNSKQNMHSFLTDRLNSTW